MENVADKFQRHMEGGGRSSSRLSSVQSGAGPSEGKTLFSQKALQLWFFTLTLTAQNETDDGIAEVVYYSDKYHDTDSSVAARFMFKKAGVRLTPYQPSGRKAELEL